MIIISAAYGLVLLAYTLYRNIRDIHKFQQNMYRTDKYWRWLNGKHHRFFKDSDFALVVSAVLFTGALLAGSLAASAVLTALSLLPLAFSFFVCRFWANYYATKLKLNYTFRVKRLLVTTVAVTSLITCIPFVLAILGGSLSAAAASVILAVALNILSFASVMMAGAINAPVEKRIARSFVDDARRILGENRNLIVVGVTGSYGKTSVKNILGKMLSQKYSTLVTPESYNTTMGVVRTVRENLKPYHQVFVVEMGAHERGDIAEICDLVNPMYSVITSIGEQHLESFKSLANVVLGKGEIFQGTRSGGTVFVNLSDSLITSVPLKSDVNVVTYLEPRSSSVDDEGHLELEVGDLQAASRRPLPEPFVTTDSVEVSGNGTRVTLLIRNDDGTTEKLSLSTKLLGKHNIENIVACASIALKLGVSGEEINRALFDIEPVKHRLSYHKSPLGYTIIDDAFNSNPVGSRNALEALSLFDGKRKFVITPGMIELGPKQYDYNRRFGGYIAQYADYAVLVGEKQTEPIFKGISEAGFNMDNVYVARNLSDGFERINSLIRPDDVLLIENDLPDIFNEK